MALRKYKGPGQVVGGILGVLGVLGALSLFCIFSVDEVSLS